MIKRAAYEWQSPEPPTWSATAPAPAQDAALGPVVGAQARQQTVATHPGVSGFAVSSAALARWAAAYPRTRVALSDPQWLLQAARLLSAAQQQAEELRQEAQTQCQAMLAEAAAQAARIQEQAREEGKAEGRRQGEQDVRNELNDLFVAAEKVSQAAVRFQEEMVQSSQQEVVYLALAIAHKLIGNALANPGEVAAHALREALLRYRPSSQTITVRVNAKDLPLVESHRDEFLRLCQGTRQWRVVADEQVGEGGCLIETEQGIIDGRLESRLGLVQNAIQEVIGDAQRSARGGEPDRGLGGDPNAGPDAPSTQPNPSGGAKRQPAVDPADSERAAG